MSYTRGSLFAPAPSTVRGSSVKLGIDAKGDRLSYCNSRSVFLVSLSGSQPNVSYAGHPKDATVAKISPTGYYCASADVSGTVRVWDLAGEEQILKSEVKALGGRVNDLAWDSESKRIVVGGDGRERFGAAFMFDSGSSVGELSGHSKVVNAVAIRQQRPFRAVTGGDDRTLVFSHGVPYKYAKTLTDHTGFVHDVTFSPSGDHFASVGADSKLLLYNGSTGDFVSAMSSSDSSSHKGTIFALSYSSDSREISTSGADKTVKIWDVESQKVVQSWSFGDGVEHQQVGNVWSPGPGQEIVSLSFGGVLSVLDKRTGSGPVKVFDGHRKSITALSDKVAGAPTFYSGSYDGRVSVFDFSQGESASCKPIPGSGHSNGIVTIASSDRGTVYTAGLDDSVREIASPTEGFSSSAVVPTGSQPKSLAVDGQGTQYVATDKGILVIQGGKQSSSIAAAYGPQSLAVSSQGLLAAGAPDGQVYLYATSTLKAHSVASLSKNRASISALSFSPDGNFLAAGDSNGKIVLYTLPDGNLKTSHWTFHTARITDISWSDDSQYAVSGSLDTNVYVWSVAKPMKNIAIKNAHAAGVGGVAFIDNSTVVSAGADAAVRTWKIKHHAI